MKKGFKIIAAVVAGSVALVFTSVRLIRLANGFKRDIDMSARYKAYYSVMRQWLESNLNNARVSSYFNENNYKTVAVYGLGTLGELFYKQLKNDGVNICCFIDKRSVSFYEDKDGIPIVAIDGFVMYKPDVVVVTPMYDFDKIYDDLAKFNEGADIVSVEDVFVFSK